MSKQKEIIEFALTFKFLRTKYFHKKVTNDKTMNCDKTMIFIFHCPKSVLIRDYSGPHVPAFGLNTERYGVSLCIQSKCGKMRTRITPNTDTFHAVFLYHNFSS